ncbi:MAG: hypothetical protein WBF33_24665 [Candidatus Nitrosopolaris sp.]
MDFNEYTCFVSTYRPVDLGYVEFDILWHFENRSPFSVYQLFKLLRQEWEIKCELLRNEPNAYEQLCKKYDGNKEMLLKIESYYYGVVAAKNTGKSLTRMPASYKNTHKRVKRLAQLNLIEEIKGKYERGARYYRISTYGRITSLAKSSSGDTPDYITQNKSEMVFQHLLFQFFEKETIDSFSSLKEYPTVEIGDYLQDCCSITISVCKEFWAKIKQYQIDDILPSDEIIQKYMSYLDGKYVDQSVLNEIKKYEKRLLRKYQANDSDSSNDGFRKKVLAQAVDSYNQDYFRHPFRSYIYRLHMYADHLPKTRNYAVEKPPFPLLDIYYNIVYELRTELETRVKSLTNDLVTHLGEIVNSEKI